MSGRDYSSIALAPHRIIFRPGAPSHGNVKSTWAEVMEIVNAPSLVDEDKAVYVDSSLAEAVVPVVGSPHNMTRTSLFSRVPDDVGPEYLRIEDGAQLIGLHEIGRNLGIRQLSTSATPALLYNNNTDNVLLIDHGRLELEAGSTMDMVRVTGNTRLLLQMNQASIESKAAAAVVISTLSAGSSVEIRMTTGSRIEKNSMAAVFGSTHRYSIDESSYRGAQAAILGLETFLEGGFFADGGVARITFAPGLLRDFSRTYANLSDALNLADILPSSVKVEIAFDDSYSPGTINVPVGNYVLPPNTILSNGANFLALRDEERQEVIFADGSTLTIGGATKQFEIRNLILRHSLSSPLINEAAPVVFGMVSSKLRITAFALAPFVDVTGGNNLTLLSLEGGAERLGGTAAGWRLSAGARLTIRGQGRSLFARNVLATTGLIDASSSVTLDPQATLETQDLVVPPSFVLNGSTAIRTNVATEPTVLSKDQLIISSGVVAGIAQAALFFLNDPAPVAVTVGTTLVLSSSLGTETYTAVPAAPGPFDFVAAAAPTVYENIVLAINTSSALYRARLVFNTERWTQASATPDVAIAITALTQPQEQVNHRLYTAAPWATGTPVIVSFEDSSNTYDLTTLAALPVGDPGRLTGFGFGSFALKPDGYQVKAICPANVLYAPFNGTANSEEIWRPVTTTDIENVFITAATHILSRAARTVILDASGIGAGVMTLQLPPGKNFQTGGLVAVRRTDGNGLATVNIAPDPADTLNGAAAPVPIGTTTGRIILNRGPNTRELPAADWIMVGGI